LAAGALLVAFACMCRYALAPVVVILAAIIWCVIPRQRGRFSRALVFMTIALVPIALWVGRNAVVAGSIHEAMGPRPPAETGLLGAGREALVGVLNNYCPFGRAKFSQAAVVAACYVVLLTAYRRNADGPDSRRVRATLFTCGAMFIGCVAIAVVSASSTAVDSLAGGRLLAPAFPAGVILLAVLLDQPRPARQPVRWRSHASLVAFCVLLLLGLLRGVETLRKDGGFNVDGLAMETLVAVGPDLARLCDNEMDGRRLYCNDPWMLYMTAGVRSRISPRSKLYRSDTELGLDELVRLSDGSALIWIGPEDCHRSYQYSLGEIRSHLGLSRIHNLGPVSVWQTADRG